MNDVLYLSVLPLVERKKERGNAKKEPPVGGPTCVRARTLVLCVLETITRAFDGFKLGITQLIEEKVAGLQKHLEAQFDAKLAAVAARGDAQQEVLHNRISFLERQLEAKDRDGRSTNLMIFGLPEQGAQPERDLQDKVAALFPSNSPAPSAVMVEVRRLGRPREGAGVKPRPVLAKFASSTAKHAALQHSKELRSRRIYLDTDLTPGQQRIRAARRDRFAALKAQGAKPFWREERLFYYRDGRPHEDLGAPPRTYATAAAGAVPPAAPPPAAAPGAATPGAAAPTPASAATAAATPAAAAAAAAAARAAAAASADTATPMSA